MNPSTKRDYILWTILIQGLFIPLCCGISTLPNFIAGIAHEDGPLNWFSTVVFWSLGVMTFFIWSFPENKIPNEKIKIPNWLWIALSCGFFFLSLDDQFQFHEKFRDHEINPNMNLKIPFLDRGEIQIVIYFIVGIFIYRFLSKRIDKKRIVRLLLAGIIVSCTAVCLDTVTIIHRNFSIIYTQTIEEWLEYIAMSCWLAAFTDYYLDLLA